MLKTRLIAAALVAMTALSTAAVAEPASVSEREQWLSNASSVGNRTRVTFGPQVLPWMSQEIGDAWSQGYQGQGTQITVIDSFMGGWMRGNLGLGTQVRTHGGWTSEIARLTAPRATIRQQDFSNGRAVRLQSGALNVLNLSYGMFGAAGYANEQIGWGAREASILRYAHEGLAVAVKAAGNDAVAVGAETAFGDQDYLASALVGAKSAIFVGALDRHGTVDDKAKATWYTNVAGTDERVQDQFLMVGVRSDVTGLYGTSFAAPIVSGYASVLGSKFRGATPEQITNRLLDTARTDTIEGYDRAIHGRGEASIGRAIAPVSIQ